MDKSTIEQRCEEYLEGTILPEDWAALKTYLLKDDDAEFKQELMLALSQKEYGPADPVVLERILNKVTNDAGNRAPVHRVHFLRRWGWAAAAVLVAISVAGYFLLSDKKDTTNTPVATVVDEIQPGKNGAVLTLADGSTVLLDSMKNGLVAQQGGAKARLVEGMLQYEGRGQEQLFNTMSTPKGRQFRLTLPDGTRVWLNSATAIRYPTAFTGNERKVEISGEAYFEVAKNVKMPFIVNVKDKISVQVLGTSFNINAYDNGNSSKTSLLEGSVQVNASGKKQTLTPGQQARIDAGNNIRLIENADLEKAVAWKNGYFNFNDEDIYEVMRQLERWYDIEVIYSKAIPPIEFRGKLPRDLSLQQMLGILGEMKVKFRLEQGRKLIIEP
jgi:ferric-dicitrate binding protein FerR (iron transport regulator)